LRDAEHFLCSATACLSPAIPPLFRLYLFLVNPTTQVVGVNRFVSILAILRGLTLLSSPSGSSSFLFYPELSSPLPFLCSMLSIDCGSCSLPAFNLIIVHSCHVDSLPPRDSGLSSPPPFVPKPAMVSHTKTFWSSVATFSVTILLWSLKSFFQANFNRSFYMRDPFILLFFSSSCHCFSPHVFLGAVLERKDLITTPSLV